jgi:hypothetical protein
LKSCLHQNEQKYVFDVPIQKNDGGENTKKIIGRYTSDFSNRRVQFNLMQ